ncbi:SCO family protein [Rhodoblastus sp.]|uniref:SCO family protein n=1 Tax=Rhodoblastus sp. TaxID=1962975 RepID=UPI003F9BBCAD
MSLRWAIAAAVGLTAVTLLAIVLAGTPKRARPAAIGGPFTLVDDRGQTVTEASLLGKPSVIYFGYTFCPEICPTTLTDLTRWMHDLGPDADRLNYVFVTVDPQRDNVKVMHDYVSSFDPRLRGFTGTPEQVAGAAQAFRVYYRKIPTSDGGYDMDQSAFLYLMGPDGKFVTLIDYGEKDASALEKLKRLIGTGRAS